LSAASSASSSDIAKLPLWRLILALLVMAVMAGILLSLAPVYFENYELGRSVQALVRGTNAASLSDDALRASVRARARELDLPVREEDVNVSHIDGKTELRVKYAVNMDFPLYQVEVHLQASAHSR
jgi:hypothetical protein